MVSDLKLYFRAYGGFLEFLKSYYLWGACALSLGLYPHWNTSPWWEDVLSIMPNLLGFSLGGYAMFLAVGDEKFRAILAGKDDDDSEESPFLELNGAFVHFIIFQIVALFIALFRQAYDFPISNDSFLLTLFGDKFSCILIVANFIGYWVFIYALALALAATFALLRVGNWYDIYQTHLKGEPDKGNSMAIFKRKLKRKRRSTKR